MLTSYSLCMSAAGKNSKQPAATPRARDTVLYSVLYRRSHHRRCRLVVVFADATPPRLFAMAKPTPLKEALKALEAKEETPKEELEVVKLYGFMPPIAKLDASLSTLKKCKKLSLSTNTIDKITSVSGMDR
jgi:hypothetical protein